MMFSTDLAAGEACGREDCQPCGSRAENRPNCRSQSILYESSCVECNPADTTIRKEDSRRGIYLGESSRSLYERAKEHFKDAEDFDQGSHMVKHWMNDHPEKDNCPEFSFRIKAKFKDCLSRQVAEAMSILYSKDKLLNSKNEYMANCLTRICVEENTYERKRKERESEMEEEKEREKLKAFKL